MYSRPPRQRKTYTRDAQLLLHLSRVIEDDVRRDETWRDDISQKLRAVAQKLIEVETVKV